MGFANQFVLQTHFAIRWFYFSLKENNYTLKQPSAIFVLSTVQKLLLNPILRQ